MNCSVRTCTGTAQVREPLPLCGTCALRVVAAYATANLPANLEPGETNQQRFTTDEQDRIVLNLYGELNRRPQWTEVRDALTRAGFAPISRPTAQRIRARLEARLPHLTTAADAEIDTLYELLDAQGWNAVDLNVAMRTLNRPKATAARRLAEARKRYAAELNRRARHEH